MYRYFIPALLSCGLLVTAIIATGAPEQHLTPTDYYSTDKGVQLARRYPDNLIRAMQKVKSAYPGDELRFLTNEESAVGGAGFWKNPAKFGTDNRYMGMLVMARTPEYIFGDNRNGHVATVLDRYGKTMLSALTEEMEKIGPPGVDGVAICIVWGNDVSGDPTESAGEGLALFLAAPDVKQYKNYKLTIQSLVNRNDLFLFDGRGEIENLLQFILES